MSEKSARGYARLPGSARAGVRRARRGLRAERRRTPRACARSARATSRSPATSSSTSRSTPRSSPPGAPGASARRGRCCCWRARAKARRRCCSSAIEQLSARDRCSSSCRAIRSASTKSRDARRDRAAQPAAGCPTRGRRGATRRHDGRDGVLLRRVRRRVDRRQRSLPLGGQNLIEALRRRRAGGARADMFNFAEATRLALEARRRGAGRAMPRGARCARRWNCCANPERRAARWRAAGKRALRGASRRDARRHLRRCCAGAA